MNKEGSDSRFFFALFLASRPKTLVACVVPVCLGASLAHSLTGKFSLYLFLFTVFPALAIQVATNFFNDAIDCRKGADTKARLGPRRMAATGMIPAESLLIAGMAFVLIALTLSLVIVLKCGWPIVAIGLPSLFFAYGYTGGPYPLAYRGLGEIFVFLFFGIIAVSATVFVQSGQWLAESFLLGSQIGLLAAVLIAINNARDLEEDEAAGKKTLAVRFGLRFARIEIVVLSLSPFLVGGFWWLIFDMSKVAVLPLPALLFVVILNFRICRTAPGRSYNASLGLSIVLLIAFAALISIGLQLG